MNQNLNLNYYEKRSNIATKIKALSRKPMTKGELKLAVRNFMGAMDCLIKMNAGLLREGGYTDKSIDKGAGRGTQSSRPKYAPVRIC